MTDPIDRADAIEMVLKYFIPRSHTGERGEHEEDFVRTIFKALPSANVEPTVIRSRTLLPTKDFEEWAKRIKEVNPNAVVIPCDAEVASADVVQGEWIEKGEYAECLICGAHSGTQFDGVEPIPLKTNYCPNCGARMKGGAE